METKWHRNLADHLILRLRWPVSWITYVEQARTYKSIRQVLKNNTPNTQHLKVTKGGNWWKMVHNIRIFKLNSYTSSFHYGTFMSSRRSEGLSLCEAGRRGPGTWGVSSSDTGAWSASGTRATRLNWRLILSVKFRGVTSLALEADNVKLVGCCQASGGTRMEADNVKLAGWFKTRCQFPAYSTL